jgi:hypothetical protein
MGLSLEREANRIEAPAARLAPPLAPRIAPSQWMQQ